MPLEAVKMIKMIKCLAIQSYTLRIFKNVQKWPDYFLHSGMHPTGQTELCPKHKRRAAQAAMPSKDSSSLFCKDLGWESEGPESWRDATTYHELSSC